MLLPDVLPQLWAGHLLLASGAQVGAVLAVCHVLLQLLDGDAGTAPLVLAGDLNCLCHLLKGETADGLAGVHAATAAGAGLHLLAASTAQRMTLFALVDLSSHQLIAHRAL
eukprot:CAMPEP_0182857584 /NCGR_PEP_ID=MMETSP0034_2-20130328/3136_1 /TAXON_ID=156128 /ORGANISM="Nephroselmis pyriformis, Strain CCMP717" /LENGTH=110 /DNA_ID=CAMNT_0024988831 /DNA_START=253 /DNA_END=582 /DNA_ORIENTATION=+